MPKPPRYCKYGHNDQKAEPCIPVGRMSDRNGIEVVVADQVDGRQHQPKVSKKNTAGRHPTFDIRKRAALILHRRGNAQSSEDPVSKAEISERCNRDRRQFLPCLKDFLNVATAAEKNVETDYGWKHDRGFFRQNTQKKERHSPTRLTAPEE